MQVRVQLGKLCSPEEQENRRDWTEQQEISRERKGFQAQRVNTYRSVQDQSPEDNSSHIHFHFDDPVLSVGCSRPNSSGKVICVFFRKVYFSPTESKGQFCFEGLIWILRSFIG